MTGQGSFDLAAIARGIRLGRHQRGLHVLERMAEREIVRADVLAVLHGGEVIEGYLDDTPFPSALILGFVPSGPLHVASVDT